MRAPLRLAAVLLLLASGASARTRDPDLPPLDPPDHWRRVAQTDAASTEQCVGNPVTPPCAIDTFNACFMRGHRDLCDIAKAPSEKDTQEGTAVTWNTRCTELSPRSG